MKELAFVLALLLLAPSALGQSVGASQIKKKTGGGLSADAANSLAVGVYRGTTAPATPVTGQLWCDTTATPCALKTYNGTAWELPSDGAAVTQADLSSLPANPTDGQIVYVRSLKRALIYDATDEKWFYLGEKDREAKPDYAMEITGSPLTPPSASGSVGTGGAMTAGSHVCAVTAYNSTGGETTQGASTSTLTITSGNQTANLTFAASGTGWRGKKVYCSRANTTTPLFYIATIDDTTTGTYAVTLADTSFGVGFAPSADFSRPLPTGWVSHTPNVVTGGCGATATGILCHDRAPLDVAVSASGPRAAYYMGATPPDEWAAEWTVVYSSSGLNGGWTTNVQGGKVHAAVFEDVTVVSSAAVGMHQTSYDNHDAMRPLRFNYAVRGTGGAWGNWGTASGIPIPVITTNVPWRVRVTRTKSPTVGDFYYFSFSSDGGRTWAGSYTQDSGTACGTVPLCPAVTMTSVGITVELAGAGSSPKATEITDFTWRAD